MSAKLRTTMKLLEHFVITTSDQPGTSQGQAVTITTILGSSSREQSGSSQTLVLPSAK